MTVELPQQFLESVPAPDKKNAVVKREKKTGEALYPARKQQGIIQIPRRYVGGLSPEQLEWGTRLISTPHYTRTLRDLEKIEDLDVDNIRRFIGGLVLDVHGTLLGYGSDAFSPSVVEKLREIRTKMKVCVLPDNDEEYTLFHELGIPVVKYAVAKPDPAGFERAAYNGLNLKPEQCAMVGDNMLTDGGAKQTGMGLILVNPLPGKESLGYKLGRGYGRTVKKIHDKLFGRKK